MARATPAPKTIHTFRGDLQKIKKEGSLNFEIFEEKILGQKFKELDSLKEDLIANTDNALTYEEIAKDWIDYIVDQLGSFGGGSFTFTGFVEFILNHRSIKQRSDKKIKIQINKVTRISAYNLPNQTIEKVEFEGKYVGKEKFLQLIIEGYTQPKERKLQLLSVSFINLDVFITEHIFNILVRHTSFFKTRLIVSSISHSMIIEKCEEGNSDFALHISGDIKYFYLVKVISFYVNCYHINSDAVSIKNCNIGTLTIAAKPNANAILELVASEIDLLNLSVNFETINIIGAEERATEYGVTQSLVTTSSPIRHAVFNANAMNKLLVISNMIFKEKLSFFGVNSGEQVNISYCKVEKNAKIDFKSCQFANSFFHQCDFSEGEELIFDNCTLHGLKLQQVEFPCKIYGYKMLEEKQWKDKGEIQSTLFRNLKNIYKAENDVFNFLKYQKMEFDSYLENGGALKNLDKKISLFLYHISSNYGASWPLALFWLFVFNYYFVLLAVNKLPVSWNDAYYVSFAITSNPSKIFPEQFLAPKIFYAGVILIRFLNAYLVVEIVNAFRLFTRKH